MSEPTISLNSKKARTLRKDTEQLGGRSAPTAKDRRAPTAIPARESVVKVAASTVGAPSRWRELWSLIFGIGPGEYNVATTIVRNQLYWFKRVAVLTTALLTSVLMFVYVTGGPVAQRRCLVASGIYAVALVGASVYFVLRQRKLDRLHGPVKAAFEIAAPTPATPRAFKKSISSTALASWAWLLLLAQSRDDFRTFSVALGCMCTAAAIRRRRSHGVTTVPGQMRYQAVNIVLHVSLSNAVYWVGSLLQPDVGSLRDIPWLPSASVLAIGYLAAFTTWRAAEKIDRLPGRV